MIKNLLNRQHILPQAASLILAFVLCFSAAPDLYPASSKVALPPDIAQIKIPEENGRISEYHPGSKPFNIFYIMDAHVNFEAQKSMAKIIEILHKARDIRLILVEGGIGDVSLSEYRVGPKEKRVEVGEKLMREGKISGEEYLNFTEDYPLLLWGIESQVLYDENLIAFTKVEPLMQGMLDQLKQMRIAVDAVKPGAYPKEFLDFETRLEDFTSKHNLHEEAKLLFQFAAKKNISITDYPNVEVLSTLIKLESAADLEKVDYERTQLVRDMQRRVDAKELRAVLDLERGVEKDANARADFYEKLIELAEKNSLDISKYPSVKGAIPYLRKQDQIDSLAFFDEKAKLTDRIADAYLETTEGKRVYRMTNDIAILESLVKLELVPEQYQVFINERERFKVANWSGFLKQQAAAQNKRVSLPGNLAKIDETLDSFQDFYRIANIRDQALVENLTEEIKKEKEPESILIAGGFHKERLIRKLNRIGFNVIVISPTVGLNQGPELYRKMLTEKWENGRWYIKGESDQP